MLGLSRSSLHFFRKIRKVKVYSLNMNRRKISILLTKFIGVLSFAHSFGKWIVIPCEQQLISSESCTLLIVTSWLSKLLFALGSSPHNYAFPHNTSLGRTHIKHISSPHRGNVDVSDITPTVCSLLASIVATNKTCSSPPTILGLLHLFLYQICIS